MFLYSSFIFEKYYSITLTKYFYICLRYSYYMSLIDKIKIHYVEYVVNKYIKKIQKNPDRIDDIFNELKKYSSGSAYRFFEWVQDNPGPRELFKKIFERNEKQVKMFFNNLIVHSGLEWIINNKKLNPEEEFPAPFTLLISPTMRCNLRCKGCYAYLYDKSTDMSKEFFDSIITQAEEMGTHFFTLLGGEPSLKIKEFADVFREHNKSIFQMFTNGTIMYRDPETLETILDLGNIIPVLSVNGRKEETEEVRGPGVYEEVLGVAEKLKEKKSLYGISLVLTNKNFKTLSDYSFYDEWIDRGALFGWIFVYMPVTKGTDISLMPTGKQRKEMYYVVREIRENKPFFLMDFWNDAPAVDGCIAARRYAHVNNQGYLEPCIFVHQAVDNLHEKSLKEAWNSDFFNAIRLHEPHKDNLLQPCMVIGNPKVLREIDKKYKPISTDGYSVQRIFEIAEELDKYSEEVAKEMEPLFKEEYPDIEKLWEERKGAHTEGFDRIWLKYLPEEKRKLLEKKYLL